MPVTNQEIVKQYPNHWVATHDPLYRHFHNSQVHLDYLTNVSPSKPLSSDRPSINSRIKYALTEMEADILATESIRKYLRNSGLNNYCGVIFANPRYRLSPFQSILGDVLPPTTDVREVFDTQLERFTEDDPQIYLQNQYLDHLGIEQNVPITNFLSPQNQIETCIVSEHLRFFIDPFASGELKDLQRDLLKIMENMDIFSDAQANFNRACRSLTSQYLSIPTLIAFGVELTFVLRLIKEKPLGLFYEPMRIKRVLFQLQRSNEDLINSPIPTYRKRDLVKESTDDIQGHIKLLQQHQRARAPYVMNYNEATARIKMLRGVLIDRGLSSDADLLIQDTKWNRKSKQRIPRPIDQATGEEIDE